MKTVFLALGLALSPLALQAEDAEVLAEYWTDSGSLPPEYAWDTTVTILADGSLTLKYCTGYATEGPACKTRDAKVSADQLAAIRSAAQESGLAERPAKELADDMIPIGGGTTGGQVMLDGRKIELIAFPVEADAARVGPVLQAIRDAIPERLRRRFMDGS